MLLLAQFGKFAGENFLLLISSSSASLSLDALDGVGRWYGIGLFRALLEFVKECVSLLFVTKKNTEYYIQNLNVCKQLNKNKIRIYLMYPSIASKKNL